MTMNAAAGGGMRRVATLAAAALLALAGCSSPDPEMVEACGTVQELEQAVLDLFNTDPDDREAAVRAAGTVMNRAFALRDAAADTDSEELQALAADMEAGLRQLTVEAITGDPRDAAAPMARLVVQMIEVCRAEGAWSE